VYAPHVDCETYDEGLVVSHLGYFWESTIDGNHTTPMSYEGKYKWKKYVDAAYQLAPQPPASAPQPPPPLKKQRYNEPSDEELEAAAAACDEAILSKQTATATTMVVDDDAALSDATLSDALDSFDNIIKK
jgi:hypothetical protein